MGATDRLALGSHASDFLQRSVDIFGPYLTFSELNRSKIRLIIMVVRRRHKPHVGFNIPTLVSSFSSRVSVSYKSLVVFQIYVSPLTSYIVLKKRLQVVAVTR
jgi:hypothetical protein